MLLNQNAFGSERDLLLAQSLFQSKKYLEARKMFHSIYIANTKKPIAVKALLGVAKCDYFLRRYYEARENLRRILSMTQDGGIVNETNLYLGHVNLALSKYKLAEKYYSVVYGNLKQEAVIGLAEASLRINDITKADVLIRTLKSVDLQIRPRGVVVKAMLDSLKGRHESAVNSIKLVDPKILKELDLTIEKAQIYFFADRLKEAEEQLNNIIKAPDTTNVNRMRAMKVLWQIYNKENKMDDALKIGMKMLLLENSDSFYISLANIYDKKGDLSGALKVLSYLNSKRLREQEIEKRLKIAFAKKDPSLNKYLSLYANYVSDDSPFVIEIARHIAKENDKKRAIEILKKATKGHSAGAASLYLSELLTEEKRFTEAKKALEFLTLDPRYTRSASMMLGEILEKEGKINKAIEYYKKIVDNVKDPRFAEKLGEIFWKQGKRDEAKKYFIIASDKGNDRASVRVGDYYYLTGEPDKALEYYKKALNMKKEDPDYLWLNYQYGKISGQREYLIKAASGSGEIAEAAKILLRQF
ncbi:MAG TPA: tetratricopeptide repeat protein [Nitrospirae bacterium]|nr:tetratricopeptide repeat protein [Nitrospirota bacterium]